MPFTRLDTLPAKQLQPGILAHLVHLERMTLSEAELADGAVLPTHQHPHEQCTYVLSGRLEFTLGADTRVLEPGMCALIPGHTPHGARALTACRVLDAFSPVREDYR